MTRIEEIRKKVEMRRPVNASDIAFLLDEVERLSPQPGPSDLPFMLEAVEKTARRCAEIADSISESTGDAIRKEYNL